MKIYKIKSGIIIEHQDSNYFLKDIDWDKFINNDKLLENTTELIRNLPSVNDARERINNELEAPIQNQEIWASGVTYYNSKLGRQEESKNAGGGSFYSHVYEADRPELFFKATSYRTVGSGGKVRIRKDSTWNVPEPELTLCITSKGKIIGYTIGNDMSSRSIEGENPLYLPQAKTYDGCAALGPCIYISNEPLSVDTKISLSIKRENNEVFEGEVGIDQIKRKFEDLVSYLFRECSFPFGCFLMTGTGIVPSSDFTLLKNDEIIISIPPIGTLINTVG